MEEEQRGEVRKVKEPNLTIEVVQEELHHTWTKRSHKNVSGLRGMSREVAREVGFCSTVPWSDETLQAKRLIAVTKTTRLRKKHVCEGLQMINII